MNGGQPVFDAAAKQAEALFNADRLDEAEAVLRQAIAAQGGAVQLLSMLARIIRSQGRIVEAKTLQERLVDHLPGNFVLRFDLAENLLLLGDFARGWREYQHRYRLPHTRSLERKVQLPRWDGARLDGRPILIHDEQGYGDTLQFLRFVPAVKARGGRVILQVHPDLLSLARGVAGYDHLIGRGELPPPSTIHCELMSLPAALALKLEDLPGPIPYLAADPALVAKWRARLASLPRPIVALTWAGSATHLNDRNRSLSLAALAPLAAAKASFVAVQKGPPTAQMASTPEGMSLLNLDAEIRSFDDTAAILGIADLLISVDSSPVHLAGALGRPVWTMLPLVPDWRWLVAREDTPWYPSMRLFRQTRRGDWTDVISHVAEALVAFAR